MKSGNKRLRLPDFIGIGPARTGTTWLHEALRRDVCLPRIKEIHFFKTYYSKGLEWYAWHFRNCPPMVLAGEICPTYFSFHPAADRIAHDLPNCKVICTLRDPVTRLYSHYKQMRPILGISAPFEEALQQFPGLVDVSFYSSHLCRWLQAFGNERVLILFHEDLKRNPQSYLDSVCSFIGIPKIDVTRTAIGARKANLMEATRLPLSRRLGLASAIVYDRLREHRFDLILDLWQRSGLWELCVGGGKKYGPIAQETAARLRELYRADVEQLEAMTKRDLSAWKGTQPEKLSSVKKPI